MVDRVYQRNVSESAPQPPSDPQTGYPTAGNPAQGVPATVPGPYWYHMVTESLRKIITDAGLEPDHTDVGQLAEALGELAPAQNIAVFDAAGTTEWPVPDELEKGLRKAHVTVIGGGGGGGIGPGAGGGTAIRLVDLTGVSSVNVTVGAGGVFSSSSSVSGDTSSFGTFISATGGQGGGTASFPSSGRSPGGGGVGGDLNIDGQSSPPTMSGFLSGGSSSIHPGGSGVYNFGQSAGSPGRYGAGAGGIGDSETPEEPVSGDGIVIVRW